MSHGQRAATLSNKLKELWGRRPKGDTSRTAENKRAIRRTERHKAKQRLRKDKFLSGYCVNHGRQLEWSVDGECMNIDFHTARRG